MTGGGSRRFADKQFLPEFFVAEVRAALPRMHFGLGRFLHALLTPTVTSGSWSPSSELWPCPLPPLPALRAEQAGARRRQRWRP